MSVSLFAGIAGDADASGVYFDHNATTPLCRAAREAWLRASDECWQNPSSLYRSAGRTAIFLNDVREELAEMFDCDAGRVVFTSGATEANHALFAWLAEKRAGRVAISAVEHPSVREPAMRFFGDGCVELPVDGNGVVMMPEDKDVALVSVMAACNETGTIQPWEDVAEWCRSHGVMFHTDATQWIGKVPPGGLAKCDFVTGSAHKFGGPKGVGFLIVDSEESAFRAQSGGRQEFGMRAGTENYPAVAAMMAALREVDGKSGDGSFRDDFEKGIVARIKGTRVIGRDGERLWNTSMLIMPEHEHVKWLTRLDRKGFQISTGSACSTGNDGPSHVLQAIGGFDFTEMKRALRISSGWETTGEEWSALLEAFCDCEDAFV